MGLIQVLYLMGVQQPGAITSKNFTSCVDQAWFMHNQEWQGITFDIHDGIEPHQQQDHILYLSV